MGRACAGTDDRETRTMSNGQTTTEDQILRCKGCDNEFVWSVGEQAFYAEQ